MSKPYIQCIICNKEFLKRYYGKNMYCSHSCRGQGRKRNPIESFWEKLEKADSGCWVWMGAKISTGYGMLSVNGKLTLAHRFSYFLHFGTFDDSLHCLHKCDNPSCVNPDHLFLGTNDDNIRDRISKGRGRGLTRPSIAGSNNCNSKLTEDNVIQIRILRSKGVFFKDIAKLFNISPTTAHRISSRESWKHVS